MRPSSSLALLAGLTFGIVPVDGPRPARAVGGVEGVVRERGGGPLAGVAVTAGPAVQRTLTDRNGRYRLLGLPAGPVTVTVTHLGFRAERRPVTIREGETVVADFALERVVARLEEIVTAPATPDQRNRDQASAKAVIGGIAGPRFSRVGPFDTEDYRHRVDNDWASPLRQPLSTFSIDVDAASYSNVRRFLREGRLPPKDAVRVEELINYFRYGYPDPRRDEPFSVTTELADAPWKEGHRLALIGIQGRRLSLDRLPPNNLVFLLDVSGSMSSPDKLPLVKAAFRLLVDELRDEDQVAIVVYAGAAGLVLPPTRGSDKETIRQAIDRLEAGGSTAGGAGIQLAYDVARQHFLAEGNNRVILATDGDFNVGVSSEGDLVRLIEERRRDGVFLTVLGFGTGNLKDSKMEQLADKGNGHYAYVDDLLEARKVFVQELGATLLTIAKDVKIQVEFNPARVKSYRLVGYENRLLADRDFNDDTKDAGELGAGHAVTALYEIVPADGESDDGAVDPLRYQSGRRSAGSRDWFTVKLRYKDPKGTTSRLIERVVRAETGAPSADFEFASAVAEFGMLLRESEYRGAASYRSVLTRARAARGPDEEGYRTEFLRLVETAAGLAAKE